MELQEVRNGTPQNPVLSSEGPFQKGDHVTMCVLCSSMFIKWISLKQLRSAALFFFVCRRECNHNPRPPWVWVPLRTMKVKHSKCPCKDFRSRAFWRDQSPKNSRHHVNVNGVSSNGRPAMEKSSKIVPNYVFHCLSMFFIFAKGSNSNVPTKNGTEEGELIRPGFHTVWQLTHYKHWLWSFHGKPHVPLDVSGNLLLLWQL